MVQSALMIFYVAFMMHFKADSSPLADVTLHLTVSGMYTDDDDDDDDDDNTLALKNISYIKIVSVDCIIFTI
jgi:hypothetical protein